MPNFCLMNPFRNAWNTASGVCTSKSRFLLTSASLSKSVQVKFQSTILNMLKLSEPNAFHFHLKCLKIAKALYAYTSLLDFFFFTVTFF